jgi:hypothetical protein
MLAEELRVFPDEAKRLEERFASPTTEVGTDLREPQST